MTTRKLPSLSIFFPAYNDGGTIASMVITARTAARQVTDDFEIIVVDDSSRDHTGLVLDELERLVPELRVVRHEKNRGYGGALKAGFAAAQKEWIFYTDGDMQYNPLELPHLVQAVQPDVSLVNGYKISRQDPLIRIVIGSIYNRFVKLAFGIHLRDVDCDYRLFRRSILGPLQLTTETGAICVEMIKKIEMSGFGIAEVPVHHYYRQYGASQFFRVRRLLRVAHQLFVLWCKLVVRKNR